MKKFIKFSFKWSLYSSIPLLILIFIFDCSDSSEEEHASKEDKSPTRMDVLFVSKYCVQDHLKSPSTAEFPYNSNHVYHVDSNRYVVNSYVDSQNSFGAMIRTRFVCTVFMKDKDSGVCHDVKFIE